MCYLIRVEGETSCRSFTVCGTLDDALHEMETRYQPTSPWSRLGFGSGPYWLGGRHRPGEEPLFFAVILDKTCAREAA